MAHSMCFVEEDVEHAQHFNELVLANQDRLIEMFGGWLNIVQLCLMNTNPNCIKQHNKIQLTSLERMLNSNGIITRQELNSVNVQSYDHDQLEQSNGKHNHAATLMNYNTDNKIETVFDDEHKRNVDYNYTNEIEKLQFNDIQVSTLKHYYKANITINCNKAECLAFKLADYKCLNADMAQKLYNFASNKYFLAGIPLVSLFCFVISSICVAIGGIMAEQAAFIFSCMRLFLLAIGLQVISMLTNTKILYLVSHTFDFWYKSLNVVIFSVSSQILRVYTHNHRNDVPLWYIYVEQFVILLVYGLLFIIDAFCMPYHKLKIFITLIASIYMIVATIYDYFSIEDYVWNPFAAYNTSLTEISFKSLYLTASFNLALFILKPVLSKIMKKMFKFACRSCYGETHDQAQENVKRDRLSSVYKRAYASWKLELNQF